MKKIYLLESHYKNKDRIVYVHKDKEFISFSLCENKDGKPVYHSFADSYLWKICEDNNIDANKPLKVYFRSIDDLLYKTYEHDENSFKGILTNSLIWFFKAGINVSFEETPQFDTDSRNEAIKLLKCHELTIIDYEVNNYWKAYSFKKKDLEARKEVSLSKGKKLGRKHSKKDEERKSNAMKQIEAMLNSKGKYKDYEIMEKTGIKRRTYYKYKKELIESKKELLK